MPVVEPGGRLARDWGTGLLLAVVAVALRLAFIADMEYKYDEKTAFEMAGQFLRFERLPLVGLDSSVGLPNPPGFVCIIAALRLFFADPLQIAICIAVLNAAAVVWFWLFCRRRIDPHIAWVAAFLFATTPWAVIFSRKIWAQDLLAPCCVALLVGLVKAVEDRQPRYWLLVAAALTFLLQLHLSSVFLVIAVPVAVVSWLAGPAAAPADVALRQRLARFWHSADGRFIRIGLLVMGVIFLPYGLLILKNLRLALASVKASHVAGETFGGHALESAKGFVETISGVFFAAELRGDMAGFPGFLGAPWWGAVLVSGGVVTCCSLAGVAVAWRKRRDAFVWTYLLAMLAGHVLYILFVSTRTGAPYFLILYPLSFLLVAAGLFAIPSRPLRLALAVGIIAINIATAVGFLTFVRNDQVARSWYGTFYRLQQASSQGR